MGNHRFRLANMMPNAWFYKLQEMNPSKPNKSTKPNNNNNNSSRAHPVPTTTTRSRTHPLPNQITPSRASYYFPSNSPLHPKAHDTHFPPETPRKPRLKPISPRPIISTSSTTTCSSSSRNSAALHCTCKITPSADDIIFDVGGPEMPIATRKKNKEQQQKKQSNSNAASSAARLRMSLASSPRLAVAKKVRAVQRAELQRRKSLSGSMAVVKNSSDPRKDFRESMMEMIRENNLRTSKDLEELLACFLSLNANKHHDVIVKAFEEIWFVVSESSVRV